MFVFSIDELNLFALARQSFPVKKGGDEQSDNRLPEVLNAPSARLHPWQKIMSFFEGLHSPDVMSN